MRRDRGQERRAHCTTPCVRPRGAVDGAASSPAGATSRLKGSAHCAISAPHRATLTVAPSQCTEQCAGQCGASVDSATATELSTGRTDPTLTSRNTAPTRSQHYSARRYDDTHRHTLDHLLHREAPPADHLSLTPSLRSPTVSSSLCPFLRTAPFPLSLCSRFCSCSRRPRRRASPTRTRPPWLPRAPSPSCDRSAVHSARSRLDSPQWWSIHTAASPAVADAATRSPSARRVSHRAIVLEHSRPTPDPTGPPPPLPFAARASPRCSPSGHSSPFSVRMVDVRPPPPSSSCMRTSSREYGLRFSGRCALELCVRARVCVVPTVSVKFGRAPERGGRL